jgi:hypothetical protein
LQAYASSLEQVLLEAPSGADPRGSSAAQVFAAMQRQRVDFTQAAIALLKKGAAVAQSLYYLQTMLAGEEDARRLEAISVAPRFEDRKQSALASIRKRIAAAQPATPEPLER